MKICADCGGRGYWPSVPHRAIRCDDCRRKWEQARNTRRRRARKGGTP